MSGHDFSHDYLLDKSNFPSYSVPMVSKPHCFLGLLADADALSVLRMSRLIEASKVLVGTLFSCSRFPFLFMRGAM